MVGYDAGGRASSVVRRSRVTSRAALLGVLLTLVGCGGDAELGDYPQSTCDLGEPPSADLRRVPLDIATFWSEDPLERKAFVELTSRLDDEQYYVSIDEMPDRVATQQRMRDAFEDRVLPDLFQVNGGSDVVGWVDGREGDARQLCALDALSEANDWDNKYFQQALAPVRCDDSLYALPVGVHHINVLFYNAPLFDELDRLADGKLARPEDLESPAQLVELLRQVSELDSEPLGDGEKIVPLAIGSESDWPLTVVAFENVLLGLGRDAYETLWTGGLEKDANNAPRLEASLREMLDVLRGLVNYSNYQAGSTWQDALRQVGAGRALFTITGDWGYAQIDDPAHLENVVTATFPGTQGSFVYTPDSFAVPRDLGDNGFQSRAFLIDVAQEKTALLAFSNAKHSIPPRVDLLDADLAQLTSSVRATYEEFVACAGPDDDCELLLAVSGLGPSPGVDPCLDEVEGVLALAVAGKEMTAPDPACPAPDPQTPSEAEEQLIRVWLDVAKRRFAASCR